MTRGLVRVLVVEDSPADIELTKLAFEELGLPNPLCFAEDGERALEVLRRDDPRGDPRLVLLDLNLPGMSGHEVLEEIRRDPALQHLPVLVLTSSDLEDDIAHCYRLGANAYLKKPSDRRELLDALRAIDGFWLRRAVLARAR